jgi:hypothetical protein
VDSRAGGATSKTARSHSTTTSSKHPYQLPVVPGFAAHESSASKMASKAKRFDVGGGELAAASTDGGGIGRTAKGAAGDTLVASHVGELDMVRIREAEKIIEADEVQYGKYIMDEVRVRASVCVCVCCCEGDWLAASRYRPRPPVWVGSVRTGNLAIVVARMTVCYFSWYIDAAICGRRVVWCRSGCCSITGRP